MSTSKILLHRKTDPAGLQINEVTTGASLSTGTLPPIEKYSAFIRHQSVMKVGECMII
jgi:hypothetical protein